MLTRIRPLRPAGPPSLLLLATLAGSFGAAPAGATLVLESQHRTVQTFALVDFNAGEDIFTSERTDYEDPGEFTGEAVCQAGVGENQATSEAHQLSYVVENGPFGEGNFTAQAQIGEEANFAEAFAESRCTIIFRVDSAIEVNLLSTLTASGNGRANLTFRIVDGEIFLIRNLFDGTENFDETWVLQPGRYELFLATGGFGQALPGGGGEPAGGSFSFSLLPTASDVPPGGQSLALRAAPVVAPNPIQGEARILLTRPGGSGPASREIRILDAGGRLVRRLSAGMEGAVAWDARDDAGNPVPAGLYLIREPDGAAARATVLR